MILKTTKELYQIAVNAEIDVYKNNIDLGTTEFKVTEDRYKGDNLNILAIAGSNEREDWLKNFNLLSRGGFKKVGVDAVEDIRGKVVLYRIKMYQEPLLIVTHSKSGVTGAVLADYFHGCPWVHVVCFAPAPSVFVFGKKKKIYYGNMTRFIDPDDIVPKAGWPLFVQPRCNEIVLPNNKIGYDLSDHKLSNYKAYIDSMEY